MPARGRRITAQTGRVPGARIPAFMSKGRITWGLSMDSAGTGTISYESVPASTLGSLRSIYRRGDKFNWYVDYIVKAFSYTRRLIYPDDQLLELYDVTIQLEQPAEDVEIYDPESAAGSYLFTNKDFVTDGENSDVLFTQGYNETELTFGTDRQGSSNQIDFEPRTIFRLKSVSTEEFEEGDRQVNVPPPNTYVLRDTTSNFDETGPKKMRKRSFRRNGQLESEILETWGFAYLMRDIEAGDLTLYNDNPGQFWQMIEYKKTDYFYQQAGSASFNITVKPPGRPNAPPVRFVVHPDYQRFVGTSFIGGQISIRSEAEYLVRQVTQGWKLVRLKKEDQGNNSLFPDDPYAPFFEFQQIPFYAETYYALRNSRRQFGEAIAPPFRIEWSDYKSLPLGIRTAFARQDITEDGKVAILYPEPNYIEPMFIESETSVANSFTWAFDPDGQDPDPDATIPGTNRALPPPRLMTGEESYSMIRRKIVSPDRYTEYVVDYSSQDPGFDNSAERYSFRESSGTPPEPQYRIRQYEAETVPNNQIILSTASTVKKYYITTESTRDYVEPGGSVNVPEAEDLTAALKKLETDLLKAYLQTSSSSRTVFSFQPGIKPGSGCAFEGDKIAATGGWTVTGVNWTLEYNGTNNELGGMLITTPGTSLTLGLKKKINIDVVTKEEIVPNESPQPFSDAFLDVDLIGTPYDIGDVFPVLPNRRNF